MGAVVEIIIDDVKKFGWKIVAGVLLMIAMWMFPIIRSFFGRGNDSERDDRMQY